MPATTDYTERTAFHPTDFRPLWKKAKTKHQAALTAKKVTFAADLGDLLDQRVAQWDLISAGRPKTLKRVQLTDAEKAQTSPAKRKATAKIIKANDVSNGKFMSGDMKKMITLCNAIVKAAQGYQSRIKGLGNPAEAELDKALTQIVRSAEDQLESTRQAQSVLAEKMANPKRYDHLK